MIEETGTHSWCGAGLNQDYEEDKLPGKGSLIWEALWHLEIDLLWGLEKYINRFIVLLLEKQENIKQSEIAIL